MRIGKVDIFYIVSGGGYDEILFAYFVYRVFIGIVFAAFFTMPVLEVSVNFAIGIRRFDFIYFMRRAFPIIPDVICAEIFCIFG